MLSQETCINLFYCSQLYPFSMSSKKDDAIKNDVWLKDQNSHNNSQWIEEVFFYSIHLIYVLCSKTNIKLIYFLSYARDHCFWDPLMQQKELK